MYGKNLQTSITVSSAPTDHVFHIDNWTFLSKQSHILNSKCTSSVVCKKTRDKYRPESVDPADASKERLNIGGTPRKTRQQLEQLKQSVYYETQLCNYCKFDLILEMAHFPDMTYANNLLQLRHRPSGLILEFNVMDALMPVIEKCIGLPMGMKVSPSEAWLRARMDCEYTKNVMNADFDWTFSSDYCGTFRHIPNSLKDTKIIHSNQLVDISENGTLMGKLVDTTNPIRINIEKLKVKEKIHFYDEIDLFEDELADHGVAKCSVKIRVMGDSFFILLRYFLRVDNVFVRFYDTRMYHEFSTSYIIRERTKREASIHDLKLNDDEAPHLLTNPAELYNHVPEKMLIIDKIILPNMPVENM